MQCMHQQDEPPKVLSYITHRPCIQWTTLSHPNSAVSRTMVICQGHQEITIWDTPQNIRQTHTTYGCKTPGDSIAQLTFFNKNDHHRATRGFCDSLPRTTSDTAVPAIRAPRDLLPRTTSATAVTAHYICYSSHRALHLLQQFAYYAAHCYSF